MKRSFLPISGSTIVLFFGIVTGCGDLVPVEEEGSGDATSSGFNYDAEPGTCDGWKVRYCQAFILCGHGSEEQCIQQAEFIQCDGNAPYSDCEVEFQKVVDEDDCSLFPDECYPRDIADRTAARELCEDVQEAACERDFFCGSPYSTEICVAETNQLYDCESRLSAVPGAEECVTALNNAACGDPLPEICLDHTRL